MAKKSGAKGAKLAARAGRDAPRKHYCPECKGDSEGVTQDMEMKPTMLMPGSKIIFKCRNGHEVRRGGTILY